MKIAIGDEIYNSDITPMMLYMSDSEIRYVLGIPPYQNILILAPDDMKDEVITKWTETAALKIKEEIKA